MSLSLKIQGNASDIRAVAHWLDPKLAGAGLDADLELAYLSSDINFMWTGEAGYAFHTAINSARRATSKVYSFATDLAEVMRAFAGRLERGQEKFDKILSDAPKKGLKTYGHLVLAPTTDLKYCPGPDSPQAEIDKYDDYLDRVKHYNTFSEEVGTWEGELETWIFQHFGELAGRIEEMVEAAQVLNALRTHNELLIASILEGAQARKERDLSDWREEADRRNTQYETYKANSRSGNPARKAAAEAAVPHELRAARRAAGDMVEDLARATRIIPGIGVVVDLGMGAWDISQGGSPSSVGVGIAGGIAGGAVAGALVTGPVGWVAGAAVVLGWAGSEGATWIWEETVPLDTREGIDAWFHGAIDTVIFWD